MWEVKMRKRSGMIVYALEPIDIWFGWTPLADAMADTTKTCAEDDYVDPCPISPATLRDAWSYAQILATRIGWDGDLREGPYFCPLPESDGWGNGESALFLLAWKMDDNGTTFVASPHRLPWLDANNDWVTDDALLRDQAGRSLRYGT
jgi:hypothetical protein